MTGLPDPALVLLVGAPASGKSTWTRARFAATQRVSLDDLRGQICDDPGDMSATETAVVLLHGIVAARMGRRLTTVVDNTNAVAAHRAPLIHLAHQHGVPVVGIFFDVEVEVCLARNAARNRQVPEAALRDIHAKVVASELDLPGECDSVFWHRQQTDWEAEAHRKVAADSRGFNQAPYGFARRLS